MFVGKFNNNSNCQGIADIVLVCGLTTTSYTKIVDSYSNNKNEDLEILTTLVINLEFLIFDKVEVNDL
uniref:Uncharacterized protein n=1 Tax=Physcomitrium patens TaxID=3218 RepID=A0A2K1K9X4_PHYPA|nr:hypothetical protein PHYPA_009766 [Physcomitrium patens]